MLKIFYFYTDFKFLTQKMLLSAPKGQLKNSTIYHQPKAIYKTGYIGPYSTNFQIRSYRSCI